MSLFLVSAFCAGLSSASGVCLSRRNRRRLIPWDRRAEKFSLGWLIFFFLSGSVGLTWTSDHFPQWGVPGFVAALVVWMLPWWLVQARHNRRVRGQLGSTPGRRRPQLLRRTAGRP